MKPLEALRINEPQWNLCISLAINGHACKPMKRIEQIMMGTRSRWQSMEANANRCLWKSMRQRRSMKVHGRIEQIIGKQSGGTRPRLARMKERRNNEKSVNQPSKQGKQARQTINTSKQCKESTDARRQATLNTNTYLVSTRARGFNGTCDLLIRASCTSATLAL